MPPLDSEFLVQRETALQSWFSGVLPGLELGRQWGAMQAVSGDASFRRYFRVQTDTGPCILVDAPAPHEDCATFVKVAALFAASGVAVPRVLAADLSAGFMCLEDFGSSLLWTPLNQALMQSQFRQARELYQGAFAQLLLIQQLPVPQDLPRYSAALLQREMDLFGQWFCEGLLQHALKPDGQKLLAGLYAVLTQRALAQPQGVVHRDFHSRN